MAKQTNTGDLPVRMITPKFRVAYPHLFKVRRNKEGVDGKYEITMLFPKDQKIIGSTPKDKEGKSEDISLAALIKNVKMNEWGPDQTKWPKNLQSPVKDGDDEELSQIEGFKGHWVVKATAHADRKPGLVDKNNKTIEVSGDLYPGCYARAAIYASAWEHSGKRGVRFTLDHVQKLEDGKTFGGRKSVEEVFGPVNAGADETAQDEDFA